MAGLLILIALALGPAQDAEALWRAGRRVEALAALEEEIRARPEDLALRQRLAERLLAVQRFSAALTHARALGPAGAGLRGEALYFLGRYDQALGELLEDDPRQLLLRAEALHKLGRSAEHAAAIEQAARALGEDDFRIQLLRARHAADSESWARAEQLYAAALAHEPFCAEAHFGRGRALLRLERGEEARAVLARHRALLPLLDQLEFAERGLALAPLHAPNEAALGDAWRALAAHDRSALARARAAYERATALAAPEELVPIALRHARLLAEELRDAEAALELLASAAQRRADPRLEVRRGDLLVQLGRPSAARAAYERALELAPGDAQIRQRLGSLGQGGQ